MPTADNATELWLRRFGAAPTATSRILCLPHAGGSASYYFPLSKALAPDADVVAVQYPGRQDRRFEHCRETVAQLADEIASVVRPMTDLPLTIFGQSLGATIAFEVARRLDTSNVRLTALFVSARRAPSAHRDERVHLLDDDGLLEKIRVLNGTDSKLLDDDEILRLVLPAIRGDYKAAETYRYQPGPRLGCPIFAIIGDNDPMVSVDEAEAWAEHTTGEFRLRTFPGGHFYLNSCFPAVVGILSEHTRSVVPDCPPPQ